MGGLDAKMPEVLAFREYLSGFDHHKRQPVFTISKSRRFPKLKQATAAAHIGPGHYLIDRDFPNGNIYEECPASSLTGNRRKPDYSFVIDAHRGDVIDTTKVGPGQYEVAAAKTGVLCQHFRDPLWTIPKAVEDAQALRERKQRGNPLTGPGSYEVYNHFDHLGKRKSKRLGELAKAGLGKERWSSKEYSNIFRCLKPRAPKSLSASAPSLTVPTPKH
eukprot:gnl/TRDRNA2_/TRDRNA2_185939_c0_seq1.p1 gnl/TRDRNA2_/TRDRNA2_185939_c0~~gnl/TRDRNA2_/TRDRNA2_185939_c0_seq1.p1  ORF type:complete len:218 (-),score=33.85 gnl/TRDRNA2_/TRDRNA2_185939_c0_seq1:123-776(-)